MEEWNIFPVFKETKQTKKKDECFDFLPAGIPVSSEHSAFIWNNPDGIFLWASWRFPGRSGR